MSHHGDSHPHYRWHCQAFALKLLLARNGFRKDHCESESEFRKLVLEKTGTYRLQQSKILKMLDNKCFPSRKAKLVQNLRTKLARFQLKIHIGHSVFRATRRMDALKNQVRPSILVVYFRTLMNGWPTSRRMRTIENTKLHNLPPCPLCGKGEDSLEHISRCEVSCTIFNKFGAPINCIEHFFCLDSAALELRILLRRVKALAATYAIYNAFTHHPSSSPPLDINELIRAACLAR